MAVQALYRKWRPRTFDEVVGQKHIVRTLRNALTSGRIHHAYLFAGPRGTGKTTTARLLAKAVNCLSPEEQRPCNECAICQAVNEGRLLDLIEIDAASNTGVDDVRELRERVGFRPNQARYKVYVIDEVHMLSTSAFNALLKTLEEPPPHAIFVLATTEAQKIPDTVISRCQRFNFRRISVNEIVDRLAWMVEREDIPADREALTIIARQATGSMRDAESLLDQLASYDAAGITIAEVRSALGTGASETVIQVTDALAQGDVAQGLSTINAAMDEGADPRQFARQMVEYLRALLLLRLKSGIVPAHISDDMRPQMEAQAASFTPRSLARVVRLFNQAAVEARGGWQPQLPLEMAFVEAVLPLETENPGPKATGPGQSPHATTRPPFDLAASAAEIRACSFDLATQGGPGACGGLRCLYVWRRFGDAPGIAEPLVGTLERPAPAQPVVGGVDALVRAGGGRRERRRAGVCAQVSPQQGGGGAQQAGCGRGVERLAGTAISGAMCFGSTRARRRDVTTFDVKCRGCLASRADHRRRSGGACGCRGPGGAGRTKTKIIEEVTLARKIKRKGGLAGSLKDKAGMLQQLQTLQEDVLKAQDEAATMVVTATAGGGAVSATVTGERRVQSLTIAPEVVDPDDVEMLQDLVVAAVNEGLEQVERVTAERLAKVTSGLGLGIPGLT